MVSHVVTTEGDGGIRKRGKILQRLESLEGIVSGVFFERGPLGGIVRGQDPLSGYLSTSFSKLAVRHVS